MKLTLEDARILVNALKTHANKQQGERWGLEPNNFYSYKMYERRKNELQKQMNETKRLEKAFNIIKKTLKKNKDLKNNKKTITSRTTRR